MSEDRFYISVSRDTRGDTYIAVISRGHPSKMDDVVIVCDVKRCKTEAEGKAWGEAQIADPEWHERCLKEFSKGLIKVKP